MSCTPSSLTIEENRTATTTCTVTSACGLAAEVRLSCANPDDGLSCTFDQSVFTLEAGGTVEKVLTVGVGRGTAGGAHTLAVTAASGDFSQAFSLSVEAEVAAVPVDGLLGLALTGALTASLWMRRRRPMKK